MPSFTLKQTGPHTLHVQGDGWSFHIDHKVSETDAVRGPSPTELLAISLAACKTITAIVWAERRGIALQNLETDVAYDMAEGPRRVGKIEVALRQLKGQVPADQLERLERALKGCYVAATLEHPPAVISNIE